jgi:gluconolactonase
MSHRRFPRLVGVAIAVFAAIAAISLVPHSNSGAQASLPAAPAVEPTPTVPQHEFPPVRGDRRIVRAGTSLVTLFEGGCALTTGPAADQRGNVYFAELALRTRCKDEEGNVEAGIIWRYDGSSGRTRVWRSPSGQANGMDFDAEGDLVVAESADNGGQRVTRTNMRTGKSVILAAYYQDRPLNAPNGVSIDERGRIYFTDPRYEGLEPVEQPVQGIYRIDPDRSVHRIIVNATKPNGVLVSPDQRTLYVANFDTGFLDWPRLTDEELASIPPVDMTLYAYPLRADGTVGPRRALVRYLPRFGPDGLTADVDGNIYVAVRDAEFPGIRVYTPEGRELARIPTGDILPTAAEFGTGAESDVLYVTAGKGLYRIRLNSTGYQLPRR